MNRLFQIFQQAATARAPRRLQHNFLDVGATESLEPGAEPETTFQKKDDEYRTISPISAAGDNIILTRRNNYDAEVLEITIQPISAVTAQLKAGGVNLSAAWNIQSGQPWSASGYIVERSFDLILNLSIATQTSVEIRWKPCYGR